MTVHTGKAQAVINVTPMIDVLLVLLIIFMAIAPATPNGLDAMIPQESQTPAQSENPVVLEIAADGSYRLNSESLKPASLGEHLLDVFRRRGDRTLFVKAADTLDYWVVASAVDTAHGANIDRVAFMPR